MNESVKKMSQLCLKVSLFLQSGHEIKAVGDRTNQHGTGPSKASR